MATLYRKYRPQTFEEVVGQNHIKITLEHEITSGRIAHAYLFCGPRAVGKTTLARIVAKAVNCLDRKNDKSEPCNKCSMCTDITSGKAMDVIEIDAASHTGVDNVRENIIAAARVAPANAKYKVFIIDEVHMLSGPAFNALLKTLEEPPSYILFILCTTEIQKVPNTIISRCQRFDFKRISVTEIAKKLQFITSKEGVKIDKKILESIARQSEGHMRDAESLLGQVVSIGGKEISAEEADLVIPRSDLNEAIRLIGFIANKNASGALSLVNNLVDNGINLKTFTSDVIEILRKMLLNKISPNLSEKLGLELGETMELEINNVSKGLDLKQIINMIEAFMSARNELKTSFIIQLPIELVIAQLCSTVSLKSTINNFSPIANLKQAIKKNNISSTPNTALNNTNNTVTVSKEEILNRWNEVLAKIKTYNHSLSFILRVCQPTGLNGNQLCLAFKYKFHKERIGDPNIKRIVEKVLNEVYGANLTIEAIVDENIEVTNYAEKTENNTPVNEEVKPEAEEKKDDDEKNMLDNLLKTFGGKVIK